MAAATKKRTSAKKKPSSRRKAATPRSSAETQATTSGFDSWPRKGGSADRQPWAADEDKRPKVAHSKPILTSGSGGPDVLELGQRLNTLGYETSISKGENAQAILDQSVLAAIERFRQDYGVREDPEPFGGGTPEGERAAANHVGPWTWEALIRASDREAE